jgi:hypothetical protein
MKFKERPEGRILERGNKQGRYERDQNTGDDGRKEIKIPKPKNPTLGRMCIYCGKVYPGNKGDDLTCPACSSPCVDPSPGV